jgi:hypothetical protein
LNGRSLYRAASLKTLGREVAKYKLNIVRAEEVRWERDGTEPTGEYMFFRGKGNENHELGTGVLYVEETYQELSGQSSLLILRRI